MPSSKSATSPSASAPSPRWATSASISPRASSSASSGPRAAARPRCCASSPASRRRPPGTHPPGRARHLARCRRPSATTASSSSPTRCSPTSRSPTTSPTGWSTARLQRAEIAQRVDELLKLVGLPDSGPKYPGAAVGRPAAAHRAGARARHLARPAAARRAAVGARCAACACACAARSARCSSRLGVTTIMVTHDQEEALSMADRIVVMNQGAIEQVGTPLEIYREPATPFVADFVGKMNFLRRHAAGARPGQRSRASPSTARARTAWRRRRGARSTCGPRTCACATCRPTIANAFDGADRRDRVPRRVLPRHAARSSGAATWR